jgi:hypothetical protein
MKAISSSNCHTIQRKLHIEKELSPPKISKCIAGAWTEFQIWGAIAPCPFPLLFSSLPFPSLPLAPLFPLTCPSFPFFLPLMASDSEPKIFFEVQMLVGEF